MAFLAGLAGPSPAVASTSDSAGNQLTDLVSPFMGTANQSNTFPGATLPFGMVQLSPDTGYATGYDYAQHTIRGFSSVHLSGVGCPAGGDLPILPTIGDIGSTDYAKYAVPYRHQREKASPGYYRVGLSNGITSELTATTRTGWQRYTFPATRKANVLLNSGQALHKVVSSEVTVLDDHTVAATITGSGFCSDTRPYSLHTVTRFNRSFTAHGTWSGGRVSDGSSHSSGAGPRGAYVRFDTRGDRTVTATTALSYVSLAGARRNLEREGRGDFDTVRAAARQAWERRLDQVRVQGGTEVRRRMFYSALYRTLLSPNTGSDADGSYNGWDGRVHKAEHFTYYQNWSLWDTYRTQAQLLSLLAPAQTRDMALSLLRVRAEGGWLPKWGYGTVETNIMSGDPVTPFLVNAYNQGLLAGHEEEAYQALRQNADSVPPANSAFEGRGGNPRYFAKGYVPLDTNARHKPGDFDSLHGPSATLEYALADAALATMARGLGHDDDARRYAERGKNYRNVFDRRTRFIRARDADGAFLGSADPKESVGFHEGTAWQYQWLVPQDMPGLVRLIGGNNAANARLDQFFAYRHLLRDPADTARHSWVNGPTAYYHQDRYNPENEPDLNAPYTYLSTGQPWKTADVVQAALTLFSDRPDGITGNDDMGTMTAWAVLSALGLYPVEPGMAVWGLTTPAFGRVDLTLDPRYYPGGHLAITAVGTSPSNRYIQSVRVGGQPRSATYVTGADLRSAHTIEFTVGGRPSRWGTGAADIPPPLTGR
ncbi:GH92 family glycosyl hydrolase [Streptantibioticus ferralitis]|uniref:GH92 family glycosyl hydrolase n=1 Tax=Streptantibioticus ferralitis TaxID=236510 RepID=A0ABT5YXD0_9ACTN|nr:GH92 family glycosyl hydrolase [Streptantibioticus ferralitis]MDF2256138.1 GH92 family glycosyl hydrolase [Streptantibioticus ferralitis]